ncbi:Hypothetical predicted protein, partial [Olea europaea subsp. europaea]
DFGRRRRSKLEMSSVSVDGDGGNGFGWRRFWGVRIEEHGKHDGRSIWGCMSLRCCGRRCRMEFDRDSLRVISRVSRGEGKWD